MKKRLISTVLVFALLFTSAISTAYCAPKDAGMLRIYKDFESAASTSSFDTVSGKSDIKTGGNGIDKAFLFDKLLCSKKERNLWSQHFQESVEYYYLS